MAFWTRSILFAALALPILAQQPCERLTYLSLPGVTITLAQSVPAGSFTPPAARAAVNVPAFCRVAGTITPEVHFEIWMPSAWNRKLLTAGNGGLAGTINYTAMLDPLRRGYAASRIKDGILNDPRRCHFDPSALLCRSGDAPTCLTSPQVEAVKKIYQGARTPDGDQIFPGIMPGGEAGAGGWNTWITGTDPGRGSHMTLGFPALKNIVFENPDWDFRTFRFDRIQGIDSDVDFLDYKMGPIINNINPDLRAFQANGGKLIQYHGWADPDISPINSINYYQNVVQFMDRNGRGLSETKSFYRLFMVPGMYHCNGGPGPNAFDPLSALEQWKEKGTAPDRMVASHATNGAVDRTRPLCPYPQEAQWKGSGSTDQADNFVCALPKVP